MSLIDYAKEEKIKYNINNIMRLLLKDTVNVDADEWDPIIEKLMEEWKDVDDAAEMIKENKNWSAVNKTANEMGVKPEEMVLRIKLMYFIAKSEILRLQILKMKG